jgi:hypothetical protein
MVGTVCCLRPGLGLGPLLSACRLSGHACCVIVYPYKKPKGKQHAFCVIITGGHHRRQGCSPDASTKGKCMCHHKENN